MIEREPKPIQCWAVSKHCKGEVKPYALVENPGLKYMNVCEFHGELWREAIVPFIDHLEIQKRLLDQEGL